MITAVVLAHRIDSNLYSTLNSLDFVPHILLLLDSSKPIKTDSFSDKITVFTRPLAGDWAAQRNYALEQVATRWALFVDADEIVTPALAREISQVVNDSQFQGYYLPRQDRFLGRTLHFGETGRIHLLRLARKDAGIWVRPVHETWQISGPTSVLKHPLLHFPHPTINSFLSKLNHYTSLEASFRQTQGETFSLFKTLVFPPAKFFHNYFFKLGFLDGFPGFVMAFMMSLHSLCAKIKQYDKIPS